MQHDSGLGGANNGGSGGAAVNKENASPNNKKSGPPLARKSLNASEAWGAASASGSGNVLARGSEASFANPGRFQLQLCWWRSLFFKVL